MTPADRAGRGARWNVWTQPHILGGCYRSSSHRWRWSALLAAWWARLLTIDGDAWIEPPGGAP